MSESNSIRESALADAECTKGSNCVSAASMVEIFYADPRELGTALSCTADDVPEPYRSLLAHTNHMTVTVERFHHDSVKVDVLQSKIEDDLYCREILLLTQSSSLVVQYGIVRLNTRFLPPEPRDEILAQKKPLGRVLIEHDVLRKIELFELLQFRAGKRLAELFSIPIGTPVYGRTAMLYCNNEPAIELLEIVRP